MSGESFVIDNSIVMTWCFQDEQNGYADGVLERLSESTAFVPAVWPLEVVNVLLVAERRERLNQAGSRRFISLLAQLPIKVSLDPASGLEDLLAIGRENNLSSYDASYLALALRHGLALATLDNKLIAAAGRVGVKLVEI